jgi:hypothetical protein
MMDEGVGTPHQIDFKRSVLALGIGVFVHSLVWYGARLLYGLAPSLAFDEALGQGMIAACWLIMALSYWQIWPPQSRFKALSQIFSCALLVGGMGSVLGLFRHALETQDIGGINFPVFFVYALGLVLAQFLLAVPAGIATTLFVMSSPTQTPKDNDPLEGDQP